MIIHTMGMRFHYKCQQGENAGKPGPCPEGGGEEISSKPNRTRKVLEEAETYKFSDKVVGDTAVDIDDLDEIENRMTSTEQSHMERYLDEQRDILLEDFEPYVERDEIARNLDFRARDIANEVDKLINNLEGEDEEILKKVREVVDSWFRNNKTTYGEEAIHDLLNAIEKVDNAPFDLLESIETYADDAEDSINNAVEAEEEYQRDNASSNYDSSDDRREYLRQFYLDHDDRYLNDESNKCEPKEWCVDNDGDATTSFTTSAGQTYTIKSIKNSKVSFHGEPVEDIQFSDESGSYDITGKAGAAQALEVFSKVVPAVVAYIKNKDKKVVTFSAQGGSRQKLYDRLVKTTIASLPDYFAIAKEKGGTKYYIVGKKQYENEISSKIHQHAMTTEPDEDSPLQFPVQDPEEIEPEDNPDWWDKSAWEDEDDSEEVTSKSLSDVFSLANEAKIHRDAIDPFLDTLEENGFYQLAAYCRKNTTTCQRIAQAIAGRSRMFFFGANRQGLQEEMERLVGKGLYPDNPEEEPVGDLTVKPVESAKTIRIHTMGMVIKCKLGQNAGKPGPCPEGGGGSSSSGSSEGGTGVGESSPRKSPGSQLSKQQKDNAIRLGMDGSFPPADVPVEDIKMAPPDADPEEYKYKAIMQWKQKTKSGRWSQQRRYTKEFHKRNAANKFARVEAIEPHLEEIKAGLKDIMKDKNLSNRQRDAAAIASVIAETGLRPTDDPESVKHGHFGIASLQVRHVKVKDNEIQLDFIGKEGIRNRTTIHDPDNVAYLKSKLEGLKGKDSIWESNSDRARDTLQSVAKEVGDLDEIMIKDLRTIKACQVARKEFQIRKGPPPPLTGDKKQDVKMVKKAILDVAAKVSNVLNNKPEESRDTYINPAIFAAWKTKVGAAE